MAIHYSSQNCFDLDLNFHCRSSGKFKGRNRKTLGAGKQFQVGLIFHGGANSIQWNTVLVMRPFLAGSGSARRILIKLRLARELLMSFPILT
jgi:hypothetical protein